MFTFLGKMKDSFSALLKNSLLTTRFVVLLCDRGKKYLTCDWNVIVIGRYCFQKLEHVGRMVN